MTKNEFNIDKIAEENFVTGNSEFNGKYNKTSFFTLPMIGLDIRNGLLLKYLKNAYIEDKGISHVFTRPLFLLFSVHDYNEKRWIDLCRLLRTAKTTADCYVTDYNCGREGTNNLVMYVFSVPKVWALDFLYFKSGKYSKFSDDYKAKFEKYIPASGGAEVESKIWGAIHKSPALIRYVEKVLELEEGELNGSDEIWDIPRKEYEYYRYRQVEESAEKV